MKLGASTGGRPPYELEEEDRYLAKQLSRTGLSAKYIAKSLGIAKSTFYEIIKKDKDFSDAIKKGGVKHYIDIERKILKNPKKPPIAPALYIWWCKTKWKRFYPQEDHIVIDKEQTLVDIKALEDIMNKKETPKVIEHEKLET